MPQNMGLLALAILLGIATGLLFAHSSRANKASGTPAVLRELGGLSLVYTLGACAFILGYIGWWGGIEPPGNQPPGLIAAFRNPGLLVVLLAWLAGFGSYRLWRG